jgi:AraC-like DNA-binding protein
MLHSWWCALNPPRHSYACEHVTALGSLRGSLMTTSVRRKSGQLRTIGKSLEREVRAYVRQCSENRTAARVSELAKHFETNPNYLSRAASTVLGRQLRAALREEQLSIAEHLLRTTDIPVHEIAVLSAFGTPGTLYRVFRTAFACRPSAYRKAKCK